MCEIGFLNNENRWGKKWNQREEREESFIKYLLCDNTAMCF